MDKRIRALEAANLVLEEEKSSLEKKNVDLQKQATEAKEIAQTVSQSEKSLLSAQATLESLKNSEK